MLFSYLKIASRLLMRNGFFTFINVMGLSIGFTLFFILWPHAETELRSDQFHRDWERIVRFGLKVRWTDDKVNWQENTWGTGGPLFTRTISEQYHEIESFTRIFHQNNFVEFGSRAPDHAKEVYLSWVNDSGDVRQFRETKIAYVDSNFFNFFSISLVEGNKHTALRSPHSVILSESAARKYFGDVNPLGQTLELNDSISFTVTGVFRNLPNNTHLSVDVLLSLERIRNIIPDTGWAVHCYLKLKNDTDASLLTARINSELKEAIKYVAWGSWPYGEAEVFMQPLADMPFTSYMLDPHQAKSRFVLRIQSYAAIVILLMAWINYTNLTISATRKRFKELGARKCVGAGGKDFVFQFLVEGTLVNLIAVFIAITLVQLVRDPAGIIFNFYIPDWREISADLVVVCGATILTGILLTTLYPAAITLRLSPKSLFGSLKNRMVSSRLPIPATTFQFCIAVILIIWLAAVYKQINFILDTDLGFSREEVIVVDLPENAYDPGNTFGSEVVNVLKKKAYTLSHSTPGDNAQGWIGLKRKHSDAGMQVECNGNVDANFISFYNIRIVAGRNFLPDHPADSNAIIISEGAAARLGFSAPDEALGASILVNGRKQAEVIGVIEDYRIRPLTTQGGYMNYKGKPGLALTYRGHLQGPLRNPIKKISFRISPEEFEHSMIDIEKTYKKLFPQSIFSWNFLERVLHDKYEQQETTRNQITLFTLIAIAIASLGLLGMIANHVVEKTKEIGIRKVLGANLVQVGALLLSSSLKQMIVASAIGLPLAAYVSEKYLQGFFERITLQWWDYALPMVIFAVIMFFTVAAVLWKAVRRNPVEALRWE